MGFPTLNEAHKKRAEEIRRKAEDSWKVYQATTKPVEIVKPKVPKPVEASKPEAPKVEEPKAEEPKPETPEKKG